MFPTPVSRCTHDYCFQSHQMSPCYAKTSTTTIAHKPDYTGKLQLKIIPSHYHLQTTARVATFKIFVWRDAHCQSLTLKPQTELFGLLLPCLGNRGLSISVCLNTNLKGCLTIQGPDHFTETSNDIIEGVNFVVVQNHPPQFFFLLLFLGLGFCPFLGNGRNSLLGRSTPFLVGHVKGRGRTFGCRMGDD